MKIIPLLVILTILVSACGGNVDGAKLAAEVCDCYKTANAKADSDPTRKESQDECMKKQVQAWDKVKNSEDKSDEFNKAIGDCSKEIIKKSFE
ncbi:MAG: hypothetical protein ACT4OJ_16050 [Bacteroidota bacterium]